MELGGPVTVTPAELAERDYSWRQGFRAGIFATIIGLLFLASILKVLGVIG